MDEPNGRSKLSETELLEGDDAERPVTRRHEHVGGPTPASTWQSASGEPITDRLLEWPPDVFALTNVRLGRAEAFRYALSGQGWPPSRFGEWGRAVEAGGRGWSAWAESRTGALPDLVAAEWSVFRERAEVRRALLSMLEERATRQPTQANPAG